MNFSKQNKIGLKLLGVAVLSATTLVACGPKAPSFAILAAGQSTFQGSTANNKVDVLWVIDNTGSMYTKQQKLGDGFSSFISTFTTKNFDFHMGVTTTDILSGTGQGGELQGLPYPYTHPTDITKSIPVNYNGANGSIIKLLDNNTPDLAGHFAANARVGILGNPNGTGLDAIELALSPSVLAGANAGFLRSEAHLAVIVVSDADDNDSNPATVASVTSTLQALKPDRFDVISRTYKKNFTVSAVVVSDPTDTNCVAPFEEGLKFKALASATNGSIANICDANFATGLTSISQKIAEAITEIPLSRVPDTSTISITFNGVVVPNDATNGWTYVSSGNKIVFHGTAIPTDNTSIAINYIPADIIR